MFNTINKSQTYKGIFYITRSYCTGKPGQSSSPAGNFLRIGDVVPDFKQESSLGPISFYKYIYPHVKDIKINFITSPPHLPYLVCTTELGRVAKLKPEFEKRNVKVIALSVDGVNDHKNWIKDINETQGVNVDYPIIADSDKSVATKYGMIHPLADSTFTVRSVYFIGPEKKLRAQITYPPSTGRSFDEILRVIDSLQLTDKFKVGTPSDWKSGGECVIIPSVSDNEAKSLFPKGWKTLKSYLRVVSDPSKK
ncbi:AhpC/TSA family protein [Tieghemostelium lacteum]|uniref:AhpC/TSA family protein n=1 Tax=Tieghemostelium lacteum TaxID=361077 RepID=A0A151Z9K6_TIELA|nr:AhpC/TSA family protein [Tieghemostelium lacteum]|eukprot:KYQ90637.1 AhpC/TSA family protein [Tieghemostelium lacteum]